MVTLGVIDGKDDGSYDPTGIVTRAEMAKLIAVDHERRRATPCWAPSASTTQYTDTTRATGPRPTSPAAPTWAIITGRGDGTFGPDEPP